MSQTENQTVTHAADENPADKHPVNAQFDELCQQYYHSWFRYHPEAAVDVGVYDYADQLRSYEHDDIGALIALDQKMLSALDELNINELDQRRQVDCRSVRRRAAGKIHSTAHRETWQ